MGNATDTAILQAKISDMMRRIKDLEKRVLDNEKTPYDVEDLASLYVAASKIEIPTPTVVTLWEKVILNFSAEQLIALGRRMRDPFPWKPFMVLLEAHRKEGFNVQPQFCHLWEVAQDAMNSMGLSLLRPGDVMAVPTRIQQAVSAISV